VVFTESTVLQAATQSENEIVSGIRTAHAADKFAGRQRGRLQRRGAPVEISAEDMERMVKDFATARGGVVRCPPAYAARSDQYRT
jgi:hypothetical protein